MSFNIGHSMKSPARGANRDIGLTGPGKGSANRSVSREFDKNMEEAQRTGKGWGWSNAKRVTKKGSRTTYVY